MGVGIEDVMAVKSLETGKVPPIAHILDGFEPDPELGELKLSKGGNYNPQYALRLGAGFGSQIAMILYRKIPGVGERINHQIYDNWLVEASGYAHADLETVKRTLRIKSQGVPVKEPLKCSWQFGQLPSAWATIDKPGQGSKNSDMLPISGVVKESAVTNEVAKSLVIEPVGISTGLIDASDAEIKSHVLSVVSEKTDYPVEMLDLELDLEADLGIDTVKQAELFASVRTHYGIPRREDLKLVDYNTLEKVIGFVKENLKGNAAQTPKSKTSMSEKNVKIALEPGDLSVELKKSNTSLSFGNEKELNQFVLQIVSEKTGYPIEMLDLGLDLEADLGIDTVKQAELFTAIRTHYGIPKLEDLRLAEYNTLAKVIGFVKEASAPAVTTEDAQVESISKQVLTEETNPGLSKSAATETEENTLRRRVPQPVLLSRIELCVPTGVVFEGGRVLIISDQDKTSFTLEKQLEANNVEVFIVETGSSLEAASEWIQKGPLLGVYCLTGLDADPKWNEPREETWKKALEQRIELLFQLSKIIAPNAFLISATRMGGLHGFMNPANPLGGVLSGFTKAYCRERRDALVKIVDFEAHADSEFVTNCLIQETLKDPASLEVGRESELRFNIALLDQKFESKPELVFSEKSVFVVSGGTGGITRAVVEDLAKRSKGSFYLLSRTPLVELNDSDLQKIKKDRNGFREELIKRFASTGEKITPVQIEEKLALLERASSTMELMHQIQKYGGKAAYIKCDVTDQKSVSNAIKEIANSEERVDFFIHAAGLEKSRKLESKSLNEFRQVVEVKAIGFLNLFSGLEKANRRPGSVVFFSSIAGRFGNAGQVDYSAGNDFLSKMAYWLPVQYPSCQFVSLDWGAWAEIGMASRGSIPTVMERAGIEMLKPAQAAPIVGNELLAGHSGEVVVAGSLGLLDRQKVKDLGLDVNAADAALRSGTPIYNMLSHLTGYESDSGITLEANLDPQEVRYLRDHSIKGTPVLPGVVGIEGFTKAAKYIASTLASENTGFEVERLENIEFLAPIKFFGNKSRKIIWKALAIRITDGLQVRVSLESDIERKIGKVEHTQHFRGLVYLTLKQVISPETATPPKWGKNKKVTAEEIYRLYFHGPSFQVLEAAQRSGDSVLGRFNKKLFQMSTDEPELFTTPLLIELCFQTAGLWEAGSTGTLGLPHSIGELKVYRKYVNGAAIYAEVKPKERDGQLYFDARVMDSKGNVYLDLTDYRTSPQSDPVKAQDVEPMKLLLSEERR